MTDKKNTLFFSETKEEDFHKLGGKGASLAKMSSIHAPVPVGFCITTDAYNDFLKTTGLQEWIHKTIGGINFGNVAELDKAADEIREKIESSVIPSPIRSDIEKKYAELSQLCNTSDIPVAVRSSATAEDLPDASFAGQQDTYLWVVDSEQVLLHTKKCWASLYTSRALAYRKDHNIAEEELAMCVVVQKMVNARSAGVVMTLDPINGDRSKIVVDASWGLGESVVSGEVTPDNFVVDKVILELIKDSIGNKTTEIVPDIKNKCTVKKEIDGTRANTASISREELISICKLAKSLEKQYGCPQDIEWAIDSDLPETENLVLLQSRPETVWSQKAKATTTYKTGMDSLIGTLLNPLKMK